MKTYTDIFCEIPCLTEFSQKYGGVFLQKKWFKSADKRIIGQYLQKFISYNDEQFKFLGVQPIISGIDQKTYLSFRSSQFVGTVPLRTPDTGKQIGDFAVMPRFMGNDRFEDYIDILNLLGQSIEPEVMDGLPLISGRNFRPPLYLEAVKFIHLLEKLVSEHWRKFSTQEKQSQQPVGRVNWTKYTQQAYKVEKQLRFPTRKNVLTELHKEYSQIRYVFDLCKKELSSSHIPERIKYSMKSKLQNLEIHLYLHKPQFTKFIQIRSQDTVTVLNCKAQANKILNFTLNQSVAWRVDFADVFEKYIQYIFQLVARETGGKLFKNAKFHSITSKNYSWELKHLEPDAVYQKGNNIVFIDAKYKSNAYNKFTNSELLKEDHRHDLHQIMAYGSFNHSLNKTGILCYPAERLGLKKVTYKNGINSLTHSILILEIPLKKSIIHEAARLLAIELNRLK